MTTLTGAARGVVQRKATIPLHMTQKMVLIVGLGMVFMTSSAVFMIATDDMPHVRVFRSVQSSLAQKSDAGLRSVDAAHAGHGEPQDGKLHRELALSFSHYAQQTTIPRGIVLPLFDGIAHLGMSVLLELRALDVDLPIEVPHCDDLKPEFQQMIERRDPLVRVYDVCAQAAEATNVFNATKRLFCDSLDHCHELFRGFNIKILSVVLSQFEEVMLLDADTLFFQNPVRLWDLDKYTHSGTLFFHDRISQSDSFLAKRDPKFANDVQQFSLLHLYLSKFDVSPYRPLAVVPRANPTTENAIPVKLHFQPSDFLLSSHAWNLRAGHEMDSSLVLWNKAKQPRATAILASFVAQNGVPPPPSDGDKELFFLACELAETQYEFSDFGVGSVGTDLRDDGDKPDSALCGSALHYFPTRTTSDEEDVQMLYLNSDNFLAMDVTNTKIYRTVARPGDFYAGSFAERGFAPECPFDIRALRLTAGEKQMIARRQQLHKTVLHWA